MCSAVNKIELKQCPFCGGIPQAYEVAKYPSAIGKRYSVVCTACGAGVTTTWQSKWRATEAWNRRVQHDQIFTLEEI